MRKTLLISSVPTQRILAACLINGLYCIVQQKRSIGTKPLKPNYDESAMNANSLQQKQLATLFGLTTWKAALSSAPYQACKPPLLMLSQLQQTQFIRVLNLHVLN